MSTVFLLPWRSTNAYRARRAYLIDRAYPCWVSHRPVRSIGSRLKIDPLPSLVQEMSGGIRVHGVWLDVRSISEKTGRRFRFASSSFCSASRANWSGIGEKPYLGP